ncbi:MAG TPA: SDR family oxidoreductase [Smithellaceae bacterium]|nr:SDR family oxidoreductase [Syntrophaceae bacterium]MBP8609181.1 SDR family oxidoreductase [Syntrophaceae bacterium]HOU05480.1 SDR family oxidoreductase [Smithellaceae bacterium]HQG96585.1 SDR family oxidoreductase [Smithellaceae bacterium]HQK28048.1 SDR family oxidoreductase [Smithellaceae bacterium]
MKNVYQLLDLKGQTAIITGGAAGIGLQMSYALGEAGANLVLASRKIERCVEVADKMSKELKVEILPVQCDVTKEEDVDMLFNEVMKKFGKVDILVNNSGTSWGAPALEFPVNGWKKVMDTNVTGLWMMCQRAGKIMAAQDYGRIINLASVVSHVGALPEHLDSISYTTSKAAVAGLTKDLAVKWARYNITVNAIAPGWFPSNMTARSIKEKGETIRKHIPLRRFGGDDELKTAVLFLASPGASYCTGVILHVDGGWISV